MPFTPKFVDLVRNITTVQGTGPAALGAAVPGYTGLAEAVLPGEQFYYCIQGVDKPAEREVGRGTLQAGGTILREPISGAATSFTGGTKTIALVAAAEWFARIELAGQAISAASRVALSAKDIVSPGPAIVTESGREGLFVFDPSDLSAKVTADAAQGVYVAPAATPSGAAGAWVRKFVGALNVRWFGAKGDGITNDGPAFLAALAYLKTQAIAGFGYSKGSAELFVPAGIYFLGTTTLDISHSLTIRGETSGGASGGSSVLKWTSGTTGIRTQAVNTLGAAGFDNGWAEYTSGNSATIRNLTLHGGYTNGAESEAHGLHLRVTTQIRDCTIQNFPGDGIYARCAAGLGGTTEGNANLSLIDHVLVQNCRNGLFVDSADVNAWTVHAFNAVANRQWGVWDSSFLGNTYTACHTAANGWDGVVTSGPGIPTACTYLGNRYYVLRDQEVGASTNAPSGTTADNIWWGYHSAGGVYNGVVAWVSGTVFREGGAYRTDGFNSSNVFTSCYSEGDQSPSQMQYPTLVVGGLHGVAVKGSAGFLNVSNDGLRSANNFVAQKLLTVAGASDGTIVVLGPQNVGPLTDSYYYLNANNAANSIRMTSWQSGVQSLDAEMIASRGNGFFINGKAGIFLRHNGANVASITTGAVEVIYSGAKLGYGAGTGGSVTQAASKSTGVTLNKASGQIMLNAASLAAETSVSFTLTNSVIAASDVVMVTIASGAAADAYTVTVTATAAGSCRIQVRNNSGGALAEALVLNFATIKAVAA